MTLSAVLVGHDALALECGRMLVEAGHALLAVASRHGPTRAWAEGLGLPVLDRADPEALAGLRFDWLLSVANLDILPPDVLALPARGAVNFHDGPLPAYAGLNAPVWALLAGERAHGITWHLVEGGVDEGRVVVARAVPVGPEDTARTLNAACFAAGLESFPEVLAALDRPDVAATPQAGARRLFRAADRPDALLDPAGSMADILRLVRALDHGDRPNPVALPRLSLGDRTVLVTGAEAVPGAGAPGTVLAGDTLAVGDGALRLSLREPSGEPAALPGPSARLPLPTAEERARLLDAVRATARDEPHWRRRLLDLAPAVLPFAAAEAAGLARDLPAGDGAVALAALALGLHGEGAPCDVALGRADAVAGAQAPWVPLRVEGATVADLRAALAPTPRAPMALDLPARLGAPVAVPELGLSEGPHVPGTRLTLSRAPDGWRLTGERLTPEAFDLLADRLVHLMTTLPGWEGALADLPLAPGEAARIAAANATDVPFDDAPVPVQVARQVAERAGAPALTHRGRTLTYREVGEEALRVSRALAALGVGPGSRVGLHLPRSAGLVTGALGIMGAGAAYVPLDPAYPAARTALVLEDAGAAVVLTDRAGAGALPPDLPRLLIDDLPASGAEPTPPAPGDLAYLIHTSGSTGRPKGVMVTHRNVANFFAGMDERLGTTPGTWLAVTSPSFDISVLELFWTLARGFHVVVQDDGERRMGSEDGVELSLFYWGNDDGEGRDKYRLLLEGARFADAHGFRAVWTPERHFHAFGGPYPNPAVTGAAVAAVTGRIDVRAGSCVAPLHHPLRIAEEWAVVDNLTNGRAGLAIASGWQPEDFVLRPEAAPPRNKAAMAEAIGQLRALWRGEAVEFAGPRGPQSVLTQPRPVSKELALWVTTAGNPETWREAGSLGANVLTHLLGQTLAEVAEKVEVWREALRAAGHDPATRTVTLMLHTYVADTREAAREAAREPMKAYLRSAAALIKGYAWAFPAFKKPQGAASPMDLDLSSLSPEEMDAILDFAFERYFEESGLFGTEEDARARLAEVRAAGVTEVACLIDYGIPVDAVLEGLRPLARLVAAPDHSVAAQVARHGVSHLQCTPSMARLLLADDATRGALGRLRHLMVGGEALPDALAADLLALGPRVTNMYGPTETTIWSATAEVGDGSGLGAPIVNTAIHVLDEAMRPLPIGAEGEIWIGGEGVAAGYWNRPDLTAERFVANPFGEGRLYRTGDRGRRSLKGLDFLGRADGQVKVRGFRIEVGEVEAALDAEPGVKQSAVLAEGDGLVAYVLGDADEGALRAALGRRLPLHMVPGRVVRLDAFPLTPNRKLDRRALAGMRPAAPPAPAPMPVAAQAAPDALAGVAAIWTRLLGVAPPGPDASFFDLGGHSLLAVQAHRAIRAEMGAERLSITDIFRFPTLGALARRVAEAGARPPAAPAAPTPVPATADDPRGDAAARRRELRARRMGP